MRCAVFFAGDQFAHVAEHARVMRYVQDRDVKRDTGWTGLSRRWRAPIRPLAFGVFVARAPTHVERVVR